METQEKFALASSYFIKLVGYSLFSTRYQERPKKPQEVSWKEVYALAQAHTLTALTWEFLQESGEEIDENAKKAFQRGYEWSVYVDVTQAFGYEEIKGEFLQAGLKILPLKGLRLKALYPKPELRQMGDMDILYERKSCKKMFRIMKELGYEFNKKTRGYNHQVFFRAPLLHAELHHELLPEISPFFKYFQNAWARAVPTDEGGVYEFSRGDEYLFLLVHAHKHFVEAGCGVRTVADILLYRKAYEKEIDYDLVAKKIEQADAIAFKKGEEFSLAQFEKTLLQIGEQWFSGGEPVLDETGLFLLSGGVHGDNRVLFQRRLEKHGKGGYLLRRLFKPYGEMKQLYPFLKKLPFLLPFVWIWRLIRATFTKPNKIMREYQLVRSQDEKTEKNQEKRE